VLDLLRHLIAQAFSIGLPVHLDTRRSEAFPLTPDRDGGSPADRPGREKPPGVRIDVASTRDLDRACQGPPRRRMGRWRGGEVEGVRGRRGLTSCVQAVITC
jgi:hypothetical protein